MRGLIAAGIGIAAGVLLAVLAVRGGSGGTTEPAEASNPAEAGPTHPPLRIASLSPALTRIAVDLGFEREIVGRSTFCTAVPSSVPVVGDLRQVDLERLLRLEPTHLLVQPPAGGLDPALAAAADQRGWQVASFPSIDALEDVRAVVRAMPLALFAGRDRDPAGSDPRLSRALRAAGALETRLAESLKPPGETAWSGPVLLVHDPDGVGAFGRGTWISDAIIELGATNALLLRGWPTLSLEDVARVDPPAIVFVTARMDDERPLLDRLGPLADLDIAAIRDGRIAVAEHPEALLPSTSIVVVIERLAAALEVIGRGPATGTDRP